MSGEQAFYRRVKTHVKKVNKGDQTVPFFYIEEADRQAFYLERKQMPAKKFGTIGKINKVLVANEIEAFGKSAKICAGLAVRPANKDNIAFSIEIRRGLGASQLRKGLKKLDKEKKLSLQSFDVNAPQRDDDTLGESLEQAEERARSGALDRPGLDAFRKHLETEGPLKIIRGRYRLLLGSAVAIMKSMHLDLPPEVFRGPQAKALVPPTDLPKRSLVVLHDEALTAAAVSWVKAQGEQAVAADGPAFKAFAHFLWTYPQVEQILDARLGEWLIKPYETRLKRLSVGESFNTLLAPATFQKVTAVPAKKGVSLDTADPVFQGMAAAVKLGQRDAAREKLGAWLDAQEQQAGKGKGGRLNDRMLDRIQATAELSLALCDDEGQPLDLRALTLWVDQLKLKLGQRPSEKEADWRKRLSKKDKGTLQRNIAWIHRTRTLIAHAEDHPGYEALVKKDGATVQTLSGWEEVLTRIEMVIIKALRLGGVNAQMDDRAIEAVLDRVDARVTRAEALVADARTTHEALDELERQILTWRAQLNALGELFATEEKKHARYDRRITSLHDRMSAAQKAIPRKQMTRASSQLATLSPSQSGQAVANQLRAFDRLLETYADEGSLAQLKARFRRLSDEPLSRDGLTYDQHQRALKDRRKQLGELKKKIARLQRKEKKTLQGDIKQLQKALKKDSGDKALQQRLNGRLRALKILELNEVEVTGQEIGRMMALQVDHALLRELSDAWDAESGTWRLDLIDQESPEVRKVCQTDLMLADRRAQYLALKKKQEERGSPLPEELVEAFDKLKDLGTDAILKARQETLKDAKDPAKRDADKIGLLVDEHASWEARAQAMLSRKRRLYRKAREELEAKKIKKAQRFSLRKGTKDKKAGKVRQGFTSDMEQPLVETDPGLKKMARELYQLEETIRTHREARKKSLNKTLSEQQQANDEALVKLLPALENTKRQVRDLKVEVVEAREAVRERQEALLKLAPSVKAALDTPREQRTEEMTKLLKEAREMGLSKKDWLDISAKAGDIKAARQQLGELKERAAERERALKDLGEQMRENDPVKFQLRRLKALPERRAALKRAEDEQGTLDKAAEDRQGDLDKLDQQLKDLKDEGKRAALEEQREQARSALKLAQDKARLQHEAVARRRKQLKDDEGALKPWADMQAVQDLGAELKANQDRRVELTTLRDRLMGGSPEEKKANQDKLKKALEDLRKLDDEDKALKEKRGEARARFSKNGDELRMLAERELTRVRLLASGQFQQLQKDRLREQSELQRKQREVDQALDGLKRSDKELARRDRKAADLRGDLKDWTESAESLQGQWDRRSKTSERASARRRRQVKIDDFRAQLQGKGANKGSDLSRKATMLRGLVKAWHRSGHAGSQAELLAWAKANKGNLARRLKCTPDKVMETIKGAQEAILKAFTQKMAPPVDTWADEAARDEDGAVRFVDDKGQSVALQEGSDGRWYTKAGAERLQKRDEAKALWKKQARLQGKLAQLKGALKDIGPDEREALKQRIAEEETALRELGETIKTRSEEDGDDFAQEIALRGLSDELVRLRSALKDSPDDKGLQEKIAERQRAYDDAQAKARERLDEVRIAPERMESFSPILPEDIDQKLSPEQIQARHQERRRDEALRTSREDLAFALDGLPELFQPPQLREMTEGWQKYQETFKDIDQLRWSQGLTEVSEIALQALKEEGDSDVVDLEQYEKFVKDGSDFAKVLREKLASPDGAALIDKLDKKGDDESMYSLGLSVALKGLISTTEKIVTGKEGRSLKQVGKDSYDSGVDMLKDAPKTDNIQSEPDRVSERAGSLVKAAGVVVELLMLEKAIQKKETLEDALKKGGKPDPKVALLYQLVGRKLNQAETSCRQVGLNLMLDVAGLIPLIGDGIGIAMSAKQAYLAIARCYLRQSQYATIKDLAKEAKRDGDVTTDALKESEDRTKALLDRSRKEAQDQLIKTATQLIDVCTGKGTMPLMKSIQLLSAAKRKVEQIFEEKADKKLAAKVRLLREKAIRGDERAQEEIFRYAGTHAKGLLVIAAQEGNALASSYMKKIGELSEDDMKKASAEVLRLWLLERADQDLKVDPMIQDFPRGWMAVEALNYAQHFSGKLTESLDHDSDDDDVLYIELRDIGRRLAQDIQQITKLRAQKDQRSPEEQATFQKQIAIWQRTYLSKLGNLHTLQRMMTKAFQEIQGLLSGDDEDDDFYSEEKVKNSLTVLRRSLDYNAQILLDSQELFA